MRAFLDAEFMEDGREIEMLSIALVREDGEEYYAVNRDADLLKANAWVVEHYAPADTRWNVAAYDFCVTQAQAQGFDIARL